MINICVNQQDRTIEIEGHEPIKMAELQHAAMIINTIKFILDKAYYSGEQLCLEFKDVTGNYHEVERWR